MSFDIHVEHIEAVMFGNEWVEVEKETAEIIDLRMRHGDTVLCENGQALVFRRRAHRGVYAVPLPAIQAVRYLLHMTPLDRAHRK